MLSLWKIHVKFLGFSPTPRPGLSSITDQVFAWPHILSLFLLHFPVSRNGCLCSFSLTVIICLDKCSLRKGWFILALGPFVVRKLSLKHLFALCMPSEDRDKCVLSFLSLFAKSSAPAENTPTIKLGLPTAINVFKTVLSRRAQR